jgi:hypothetical protein
MRKTSASCSGLAVIWASARNRCAGNCQIRRRPVPDGAARCVEVPVLVTPAQRVSGREFRCQTLIRRSELPSQPSRAAGAGPAWSARRAGAIRPQRLRPVRRSAAAMCGEDGREMHEGPCPFLGCIKRMGRKRAAEQLWRQIRREKAHRSAWRADLVSSTEGAAEKVLWQDRREEQVTELAFYQAPAVPSTINSRWNSSIAPRYGKPDARSAWWCRSAA